MKVLFVHCEEDHFSVRRPIEGFERMHFGISYISAVLKRAGHETRLLVPTLESGTAPDEFIREYDPGLICFTSVFSVFGYLTGLAARIKKNHPEMFLLAGGPHASLNPVACLGGPFDAVCVGEGEYPTLELVEQLDEGKRPSGIPNLYISNEGKVERNTPRPFNENLEDLPFPDREMWLPWIANPYSRPSILAGRGCPFRCTYCCNHALAGLAEGRYVRLRDPGDICREVRRCREDYPYVGEIYLEVETLGSSRRWAIELCGRLERLNTELEAPVMYGSNLRITPGAEYDDLFEAFRRANFRFINIGIESGSERIRREVLNRDYSNEDILRTVQAAREHGLEVGTYNLIGLPGETRREFRETVKINRACQPDWFLMSVFFPYPGTELYETCREMGLMNGRLDHRLERRRPVLDLPGFRRSQIRRRYAWSPLLIYGGHRDRSEIMWLVTMCKVFSNPTLLNHYRRYREKRSPHAESWR